MYEVGQWLRATCTMVAACLLVSCARAPVDAPSAAAVPEAASGYTEKTAVVRRKFMVAAANPYATHAGYLMLQAGGTAVDAARAK